MKSILHGKLHFVTRVEIKMKPRRLPPSVKNSLVVSSTPAISVFLLILEAKQLANEGKDERGRRACITSLLSPSIREKNTGVEAKSLPQDMDLI